MVKVDSILKVPIAAELNVAAEVSVAKAVEKALKPLILTSAAAMLEELKSVLATLSLVKDTTPVAPLRPNEVASEFCKATFKELLELIPIWKDTSEFSPFSNFTLLK